ncbi:inorganic diphosphatase [Nitrosovibrio tenuis]|uniref:inorganic diphosphatase n=1 Tax=Nitrosovibrio tenuis TaxID=1233 RepID=A0A1H7K6Q8_9PROT|nr:inorganic diphosphatase [Nitrosovibrio tenuis]SEK82160.1 inorganic pyrophosphatase [Nitrosovibrio tenuis]
MTTPFDTILPRTGSGLINIIIDTPKGSRNKFKYDEEVQCFRLSRILPTGAAFPFDFGSIPKTLAEDGDALDVLLITEAPSFPGCLVSGKLIGIISAEQTEKNKTIRNDRLLAVPVTPANPALFSSIDELPDAWLTEIEHFFISYNRIQGREYKPLNRGGPEEADKALSTAERRYKRQEKQ